MFSKSTKKLYNLNKKIKKENEKNRKKLAQ